MKKIILIGATVLLSSGAILIANNNGNKTNEICCDKSACEKGVCKPTADCPEMGICCQE